MRLIIVSFILVQFVKECPAESVMGEKLMMPALVSADLQTEWKVFRKYIASEKKKGLTFSMQVGWLGQGLASVQLVTLVAAFRYLFAFCAGHLNASHVSGPHTHFSC